MPPPIKREPRVTDNDGRLPKHGAVARFCREQLVNRTTARRALRSGRAKVGPDGLIRPATPVVEEPQS